MRERLLRRVAQLEDVLRPTVRSRCAACGLEHARTIGLDEVRSLIRLEGVTPLPNTIPPGPFCLCSCCADHRPIAELTHQVWGVE